MNILAEFLADLVLLTDDSLKYLPSHRASAVLLISCVSNKVELTDEQIEECTAKYEWCNLDELADCVRFIKCTWVESRNNQYFSRYDAIHNKYKKQNHI